MNSWTQESRAENIYWSNTRILKAFLLKPKIEEKENRPHFFLRTSKLQIFSSRLLHLNDLQGISNRRWKRKFKSGNFLSCNQKRKKRRNRQQSTWSLPSEKWISLEKHFGWRMSFLQRLLLQRDPTTTEKLQNGLVNEEVCKIVATHKWIVNIFCFDVSSNVLKSYVEDMKNFVTSHLYSKRRDFPGSLDNSSVLN